MRSCTNNFIVFIFSLNGCVGSLFPLDTIVHWESPNFDGLTWGSGRGHGVPVRLNCLGQLNT